MHSKASISGKNIRSVKLTATLFFSPSIKDILIAPKRHHAEDAKTLVLFQLMADVVAIVMLGLWPERSFAQAEMAMRADQSRDYRLALGMDDLRTLRNLNLVSRTDGSNLVSVKRDSSVFQRRFARSINNSSTDQYRCRINSLY